jgi:hypothetical protein
MKANFVRAKRRAVLQPKVATLLFAAAATLGPSAGVGCSCSPPAHSGSSDAPVPEAARPYDRTLSSSPHFDEVFQKSSHNAYWINNAKDPLDPFAAGTQMRLWDQIVHEHVRSVEWDLHRDIDDPNTNRGHHPGEYRVYHTNVPANSTCFSLADCLQLLQRLDYVLPDHEVVHIALELKQVDRFLYDDGLFDDPNFRPEEIDRLLWEHLGSRLYTPAEFMSRCASSLSLRDCAAQVGWPTIDQLRGRYIVTVHGTEVGEGIKGYPGACNERAWWQYASVDIRTRAAFPMFVVDGHVTGIRDEEMPSFKARRYNVSDPSFVALWRHALDNTIFWQLEDPSNPDFLEADPVSGRPLVPIFRRYHGIVRSTAAHLVDHPVPDGEDEDSVGKIMQTLAVSSGWQMVMTDYPANFIWDVRAPGAPPIASQVDRPFFEAADVALSGSRTFSVTDLREPGYRIYFDTANRVIDHDLFDLAGARRTGDPNREGAGKLVRVAPPYSVEPVEDWEAFPATSMAGHLAGPLETTPFGEGCLDIGNVADYSGDLVRVCRAPVPSDDRAVNVEVTVRRQGAITYDKTTRVPHHILQTASFGDALRVRVERGPTGTVVQVFTAAEVNPDGTMLWLPYADGPFTFGSDLAIQGLFQQNDGVFVGTRLNGAYVRFSDLSPVGQSGDGNFIGPAYDLSACTDGSCRGAALPSPRSFVKDANGIVYVAVHETEGPVFNGQWRTLYTSNRFEVSTSGLNQYPVLNKFFLQRDAACNVVPLYRCIDWTRDLHTYWLDLDPSCPNDNGPPARSAGILGYLAKDPVPGAEPLYHLRKGTENIVFLGPNTHDHYFAVGEAQRAAKRVAGYEDVAPAGWAGPLPHPVGYVFPAVSGMPSAPGATSEPPPQCVIPPAATAGGAPDASSTDAGALDADVADVDSGPVPATPSQPDGGQDAISPPSTCAPLGENCSQSVGCCAGQCVGSGVDGVCTII